MAIKLVDELGLNQIVFFVFSVLDLWLFLRWAERLPGKLGIVVLFV